MKVLDIIRKDLKIILSDRKAIAIILLMPIVLTAILSYALKGSFETAVQGEKMQVAIVKSYDKSADLEKFRNTLSESILARRMDGKALEDMAKSAGDFDVEELFFDKFLGSDDLKKIMGYRIEEEENALRLLREGKVSAVVILPEGFVYNMSISMVTPFRNEIDIKVIGHPDKAIEGEVARSIFEAFADKLSALIIGKNVILETAMQNSLGNGVFNDIKPMVEDINDQLENIKVDAELKAVEGKKGISSFDYYAAAIMAMFMLFAAGHGGRTLLEEKQNSTYQRMIIAGTPKLGILAGKFFTVYILALIQMTVMIAFSSLVLKVQWGEPLLVAVTSICAAFAIAGAGIIIAAAAYKTGNDRIANTFELAIIQIMALLGGSYIPLETLPGFIQKLNFLSLSGVALKAYLGIMMGYGLGEIARHLLELIAVGIGLSALAVYIFSSKGGEKAC